MRADRLVSLALLLQARGRLSARALAAELEVSVFRVGRVSSALVLPDPFTRRCRLPRPCGRG